MRLNPLCAVLIVAMMSAGATAARAEPAAPSGLSLSLGPYLAVNMGDDDPGAAAGAQISARYLAFPALALTFEQAAFHTSGARADGAGGRSALGADLVLTGADGATMRLGGNAGASYVDGSFGDGAFLGPELGVSAYGFEAKLSYDVYLDRAVEDGVVSATVGYGLSF